MKLLVEHAYLSGNSCEV